jgi:peptidoglycan/LPS O-acetylase OafA/YrhL
VTRIFSLYWPLLFLMVLLNDTNARQIFSSPQTALCGTVLIGSDWILNFASYPVDDYRCFPNELAPAWTLGAELTFYAFAPFLLRYTRLALAVFCASAALRLAILALAGPSNAWTYHFLPATICFFLLGHFARVLFDRWRTPAIVSFGLLAGAVCFSLPSTLIVSWDNPYFYASILCFAAALPGVFAATRRLSLLNWLGTPSFPLYLTHAALIHAVFNPTSWLSFAGEALMRSAKEFSDPATGGAVVITVFCFFCIAAAIIAHYVVEDPFGRVLKAVLRKKQSEQPLPIPSG